MGRKTLIHPSSIHCRVSHWNSGPEGLGFSCRHWTSLIDSFSHIITQIHVVLWMTPSVCLNMEVLEINEWNKFFNKVNQFCYQNVPFVLTKKMHTHTWYFYSLIKEFQTFEIWITVAQANVTNIENRRYLIIWNIMTSNIACSLSRIYSNTYMYMYLTQATMRGQFCQQWLNTEMTWSCMHWYVRNAFHKLFRWIYQVGSI